MFPCPARTATDSQAFPLPKLNINMWVQSSPLCVLVLDSVCLLNLCTRHRSAIRSVVIDFFSHDFSMTRRAFAFNNEVWLWIRLISTILIFLFRVYRKGILFVLRWLAYMFNFGVCINLPNSWVCLHCCVTSWDDVFLWTAALHVNSWSHSPMDELQPTVAETLKFVSISMCDVCDCVFAEQSCGISIFLHEPIPIIVTLDHQVVALSSPRSYACMTSASDVSQFHEWSENGIWIIATAIYWVILLMHYWLVDLHNSAWRRSCFNVFVVYCGDRTYWLWGLTVSTTAHEYRRSIIAPSSLNNKLCKSWAFTLKSLLFTESSALRIIGSSPHY